MKVRAVIKLIEVDGWWLVRQTGSHRQFRHPIKPGTVDGCWEAEHGRASGTLVSILRQAGLKGPKR